MPISLNPQIALMHIPYSQDLEKIEGYILGVPLAWQEILWSIHEFVLASSEQMHPCFKYKVPFYSTSKNICFLNLRADKKALDIGFMNGPEIEKEFTETQKLFSSPELKMIRHYKVLPFVWEEKQQEELAYILECAINFGQSH